MKKNRNSLRNINTAFVATRRVEPRRKHIEIEGRKSLKSQISILASR